MKNIDRSRPYDKDILDKLHKLHLEMLQDVAALCKKYNLNYFAVFGTALGAERHKGFIPWDDDTDIGMLREDYDIFIRVVDKELGDKYRIMTPEVDKKYACNVTKLQRKGTVFISHLSKKLKCEQCIFVDIFPFDRVAPTLKQARRQQISTTFLSRLLYLCGTPYPLIPYKGIKKIIAEIICWCTYYLTKILPISTTVLYKQYVKECTRYNNAKTNRVTSFCDAGALQYIVSVNHMFPIKEVPYEDIMINVLNNNKEHLKNVYGDFMKIPSVNDRINHVPYIIQFEGEKPIIHE